MRVERLNWCSFSARREESRRTESARKRFFQGRDLETFRFRAFGVHRNVAEPFETQNRAVLAVGGYPPVARPD